MGSRLKHHIINTQEMYVTDDKMTQSPPNI